MYNFDEIIDRKGSGCIKYEAMLTETGREDLLPLWIADMDFKTPDFIVNALKKRLEHPIFGYTNIPKDYFNIISKWVQDLHSWSVEPTHIRYVPGIVKGIGFVLNCFLKAGDQVVIQPPVYHPFRLVPQRNGYEVLYNPLIPRYDESGVIATYDMDFEGLKKLIGPKTKLLILSNPHNPAGLCWPVETLRELAHICSERGVMVISDEIHAEMALYGNVHHPFASVSDEAASCSISFLAPSKTFNIAGVVSSYTIVPDAKLREKFFNYLDANEFDSPNIFSIEATEAAYTQGAEWRREMLSYLQANSDFVASYLEQNIPQLGVLKPQASFLMWLDCRRLGLSHDALRDMFINKARLFLNDGTMFGQGGEGYMRLNIGVPRSVLKQALGQLKEAVESL